jgi:hypothetical protein
LATAGQVEALQDSRVDRRGDGEHVVGEVARRVADERADRRRYSSTTINGLARRPLLPVRRGTAEEVVVRHVLSECLGELIGQVAGGEPAEDRSVGVVEAGSPLRRARRMSARSCSPFVIAPLCPASRP